MSIEKITSVVKDYKWGGKTFIPNLLGLKPTDKPAAELWMGAHPSGCSRIKRTNETLLEDIKRNPKAYDNQGFPFLFKVLSIEDSLSLQVHPNAEQAARGWASEEEKRKTTDKSLWNYQDSNPKIEIFYSLTPVTAMCGLRNFNDTASDLSELIPISWKKYFTGIKTTGDFFHCLYHLEKEQLSSCIYEMKSTLGKKDLKQETCFIPKEKLAYDLTCKFSLDPGVFAPYFMNMVYVNPGECILLPACIIHAYTYGNGIELMTNSDNVLRAGLTPKHMDVEELETVMSTSVHEHCSLSPEKTPQGRLFRVPSYFSMLEVKKGSTSFKGGSVKIAFCVDGKCKIGSVLLNKGECCLIDAEEKDVLIENNGSTFIASNDK